MAVSALLTAQPDGFRPGLVYLQLWPRVTSHFDSALVSILLLQCSIANCTAMPVKQLEQYSEPALYLSYALWEYTVLPS